MFQFEVDPPSRNFPGKTEENHEESESGQSVSNQALNMEHHDYEIVVLYSIEWERRCVIMS
jgi:hypothetical protein